ncbi:MAG: hypothetical protein GXP24_14735 [Planctomycetes bacterium]|nr:hypothetical protein [Planctomycetota bacterium]
MSDSLGYGSQSGDQAIAHGGAPDGFPQPNPLVGIFDAPVSTITLWSGDDPTLFSDIDIWTLRIFSDAAGTTEIGSGVTATDATTGLGYSSITRLFPAGILRFEASSSTGVGFDTLSFTPVPEPGAIGFGIIASIGLVVGGVFRSKKEK